MSETKQYAIIARNVCFDYRNGSSAKLVLNNVNVNVEKAEIYGLLGPSGCGKTTLLKVIIGLIKPNNGEVNVFGYKPGSKQSGTPGIGVGYMPQEIALPQLFTIKEVFKYFSQIYLIDNKTLDSQMNFYLNMLQLRNENELIANLSGGEKRRVSMAIAMFSNPRLLILDEPTVGLDPMLRSKLWSILVDLVRERKTTIIVTTHYTEEMKYANTIAFMRNGRILIEEEPNNFISKYKSLSLEEVLLKICAKEKQRRKSKPSIIIQNSRVIRRNDFKYKCMVNEPLKDERNMNQFALNAIMLKATMWRIFKTYFRHGGPYFAFTLPILVTILMHLIVGSPPKDTRLGFVVDDLHPNGDNTTSKDYMLLPDLLHRIINNSNIFEVVNYENTSEAIKDAKRLKIIGFIHLKQNFSDAFFERDIFLSDDSDYVSNDTVDTGSVHLIIDVTIRPLFELLEHKLIELMQDFREEAYDAIGVNRLVAFIPLKLDEPIYGSFETDNYSQFSHNITIAIFTVVYFGLSCASTAITILMDINDDTYSRSFAAGIKPYIVILGDTLTQFIIMGSSALINLFILIFAFRVPYRGSLFLLIINIMLQTMSGLSLGAMVALCLRKSFLCHMFLYGIFMFAFILSDSLRTTYSSPYFIKLILPFTPCYNQVNSMLTLFNHSYYDFVTQILPSFVSSLLYIIVSFITGYVTLK